MGQLTQYKGQLIAPVIDYFLLDGSGSMMGEKWLNMLQSIDSYAEIFSRANVNTQCILHVFDSHNKDNVQVDDLVKYWPVLTRTPPSTQWGGTPLHDAINIMARRIRELKPPRCRIVICTDGKNTQMDCTTSEEQARKMLDWLRAQGYQVTFFGCDFNNTLQAKRLGANESNTIGVQRALLEEGAKLLANKSVRNERFGDDISFTDDERSEFGGYLTAS